MNVKKLMKQMQSYASQVENMQKEINNKTYEGKSGGGLVIIVINGNGGIISIKIDNSLMKPEEKEVLEDLIVAAHTDAKQKMENDSNLNMSDMFGGGMPGGFKMPY